MTHHKRNMVLICSHENPVFNNCPGQPQPRLNTLLSFDVGEDRVWIRQDEEEINKREDIYGSTASHFGACQDTDRVALPRRILWSCSVNFQKRAMKMKAHVSGAGARALIMTTTAAVMQKYQ